MKGQIAFSEQSLGLLLSELRLPTFRAHHTQLALRAERENWSFGEYLGHLSEMELADRRGRRIGRNLKSSCLPAGKLLSSFEMTRISAKNRKLIARLGQGGFLKEAQNVLAFGLPGVGKTHLLAGLGHELVKRGFKIYFTPAYALVQKLLVAKRELRLERVLGRLDRFDAVIIDDIGYIQQAREEMEVLFTFLAERYERRSVLVSSNLVFSQWDKIFKDAMTTAAAIDRLVHHSIILELDGPSYRVQSAKKLSSTH